MARKTFRKVITSPELIEQINPLNQKLVTRYLKNFDTKRADSSVKVYKSNFNIFFCWNILENDNKFFVDIRKSEMVDFFDYCITELKWSSNRYAQMWSSLSSLSTFIENILDDEYPDFRNIVKKIEKVPKAVVREKTILSEEQVVSLLEHLVKEHRTQEACLFALAVCSGCRASELFRFTTDVIDENNTAYDGLFLETSKEIVTKGRGKTGKLLYKYILKDKFLPYYNEWIKERNEILKKTKQEHDFLFIKQDGTPASVELGETWCAKWEKFLNEDEKTNPNKKEIHLYFHSMRHYLCTYLSRVGLEQELIVDLFGWSSSDMYKIYNDLSSKDKKWKGLDKLKTAIQEDAPET